MRYWESIASSETALDPSPRHGLRLKTLLSALEERHKWRLLAALTVCVFAGCGSGNGKFALSGTVSIEGQPLEQGSISFTSATPGSRSSTGGAINNGTYSIAAEDGLVPGTYRVTISAADVSNATEAGLPANGMAFPSLIDPDFNRANHEIVVTADGPNDFPFDVPKSKKKTVLPF